MDKPRQRETAEELRAAVSAVLAYLYDDEKAHFERSPPGERRGHIFPALEQLRQWLRQQQSGASSHAVVSKL